MINEEKAFEIAKQRTFKRLMKFDKILENLDFQNFIESYLPDESDIKYGTAVENLIKMSDEKKIDLFVDYINSQFGKLTFDFWDYIKVDEISEILEQVYQNQSDKQINKIRSKVDSLLQSEKFITWDKLGISLKHKWYDYISYEAQIVFDYMKELDFKYVRYSDKSTANKMSQENAGFLVNIKKIRNKKYKKIIQNNKK